jgi:hypothetical protein
LAAVVAVASWLVVTRLMPGLVFREAVGGAASATITAGDRDAGFFGADWPRLDRHGPIATRVASGARATIVVPLPAALDYDALLRVDPSPAPMRPGAVPARIQLLFNGRLIGACDPGSTPDRIGLCRMVFPADAVRAGANTLTVVTDQPTGFRVWYLRVTKKSA